MVKKSGSLNFALHALGAICLGAFLDSCSTARVETDPAVAQQAPAPAVEDHGPPGRISALWKKRLNGYVTDLAVSADGKALLVASAPNHDAADGSREYRVRRFDAAGEEDWSVRPSAPVKSLAISRDGKVSVVATYDDTITAYDEDGDILWTVEATCRPVLLARAAKFVCYHDDDAEPRVAFDVFDLAGKKLLSHAIQQDILALKVSRDERNLAIALTGGQVVLFGPDFKPVWQRTLAGEVSDLDVTSGPEPRVAALFQPEFHPGSPAPAAGGSARERERARAGRHAPQRIALIDPAGRSQIDAEPAQFCEQVTFTDNGDGVVVHGNGSQGQYVGVFTVPAAGKGPFRARWSKVVPHFSDNSARLMVAPGQVIVGFEEATQFSRQSRLMSLGSARGNDRWSVPIQTDEGAYLYTDGVAGDGRFLVIGSDDGRVAAFRFE